MIELKQDGNYFIPDSVETIEVENCKGVFVFSQSIEKVRSLRQIRLANIGELILHEKSFSWKHNIVRERRGRTDTGPGLVIRISDSNLTAIPNNAFEGHIDVIDIENTKVGNIKAFAFSSLEDMNSLKIKNCHIDNFEQHSFKKFVVDFFLLEGGTVGVMNSYTVRDIIVNKDMTFQSVRFNLIKTLAVTADGPSSLHIQRCIFDIIETEAFKINAKGPVFIDDNVIRDLRTGAFVGITLDTTFLAHNNKQDLVFENNTVTKFNSGGFVFNTTGLNPRIERLVLDVKCNCNDVKDWQTKLVKYQGHQNVLPDVTQQTWCYDDKKAYTLSQYYDKKCKGNRTTFYIILGLSVTGAVLTVVCIGGFLFYRKWKRMYKAVKTNRDEKNVNRLSTYSNTSNHIIVLPQPKTYLETEIDGCDEEVQPLKNSQNDLSNLKMTGL